MASSRFTWMFRKAGQHEYVLLECCLVLTQGFGPRVTVTSGRRLHLSLRPFEASEFGGVQHCGAVFESK